MPADEPLALQPLLRLVKQSYAKELASTHCNQRKLSTARVDFFELCRLLGECSDDPEDYSDPDRLLESEPENETVD